MYLNTSALSFRSACCANQFATNSFCSVVNFNKGFCPGCAVFVTKTLSCSTLTPGTTTPNSFIALYIPGAIEFKLAWKIPHDGDSLSKASLVNGTPSTLDS